MCSTRNAFALAVGLIVFAGCQRTVPPPMVSPVNNPPTVIDQATQLRNYDQSTSWYATGASVSGGTGYLWQTHETIPPENHRFIDVPVALVNMISMPVGIFIEAPWEKQVERGESVPPSYTAQPPLP
jgi:hypothetical protein